MTNCTTKGYKISNCKRRKISLNFKGGNITSDAGGSLLIKETDIKIDLLSSVSKVLVDPRKRIKSCHHSLLEMLRQRVYGIALGYEDGNDHAQLRNDIAFQTSVGKDSKLASPSTLCRFENWMNRKTAVKIHEQIVEQFIKTFDKPPKKLVLDFDATDDLVHGNQEGKFFHGYYDSYCFLPLYVFCNDQLLVSYLRESKIDGAKHSWAILSLLVKRLRKEWPEVQIIFRGDSGFCRPKMMDWCERKNVDYIIGIAKNPRLIRFIEPLMDRAERNYNIEKIKQRMFEIFEYAAKSWTKKRTVIGKDEYSEKGHNPRFIVTSITGWSQLLYDDLYCARGNMENRIKEQQLGLFADRTSCHKWYANQFRLLLSSLAYILIETIRRVGLKGTKLEKAQCDTIRLKILKIGAIITRNTRTIRFFLSSSYPWKKLFLNALKHLAPA